jgi:hypothetical protein
MLAPPCIHGVEPTGTDRRFLTPRARQAFTGGHQVWWVLQGSSSFNSQLLYHTREDSKLISDRWLQENNCPGIWERISQS